MGERQISISRKFRIFMSGNEIFCCIRWASGSGNINQAICIHSNRQYTIIFTNGVHRRKQRDQCKMSVCFAFECNHNSMRESCRFFRFPKNAQKRKIWITAARCVFNITFTLTCQKYFVYHIGYSTHFLQNSTPTQAQSGHQSANYKGHMVHTAAMHFMLRLITIDYVQVLLPYTGALETVRLLLLCLRVEYG